MGRVDKIAVLIKNVEQQDEGLRTNLGLLLDAASVQMYVLDHEIENIDAAYWDDMNFLNVVEGERYSNIQANVEKYGFKPITIEEMLIKLKEVDLIIPF